MSKWTYTREILIGILLVSILAAFMVLTFRSGDQDGDGFNRDIDCDDTDESINPDALEVCDGIDNDCDGEVDEDVDTTFYMDIDGDGYGTALVVYEACVAPSGYVSDNTDCDDTDASINPGAEEVLDNIDNNCDGEVDEPPAPTGYYEDTDDDELPVQTKYYHDKDSDSYGLPLP